MMQPPFFGGPPGMAAMPQFNNLYKTQYCKHFQQTKHCHVGARCHFAHGEHELRKREEVSVNKLSTQYNIQAMRYFCDMAGKVKSYHFELMRNIFATLTV